MYLRRIETVIYGYLLPVHKYFRSHGVRVRIYFFCVFYFAYGTRYDIESIYEHAVSKYYKRLINVTMPVRCNKLQKQRLKTECYYISRTFATIHLLLSTLGYSDCLARSTVYFYSWPAWQWHLYGSTHHMNVCYMRAYVGRQPWKLITGIGARVLCVRERRREKEAILKRKVVSRDGVFNANEFRTVSLMR